MGILLATSVSILAQPESPGPKAPRYVEGELLVKFKGGPKGEAAGRVKSALKHKVKRDFDAIGWQHIQLPPGLTVEEALARYQNDPDVLAVEPNYILPPIKPPPMPAPTVDFGGQESSGAGGLTPNDPRFTNQWGPAKIHAPEAWAITTGSTNVVVAVIDTGINYDHEDLQANMWRNPGEIPGNGIDDDGNGYVDDVYGIDPCYHDSDPLDEGTPDASRFCHGTACAGVIGAGGNNGRGLAGVNWSVQLMAIRATGANQTSATLLEAFNYALMMKRRGVNLRVINASFGAYAAAFQGYPGLLQAWGDAFAALGDAGVLAVCAAMNDSTDTDVKPGYPASFNLPNIISVAASDQNDNLAGFSNYGRTNVDLAAPGVGILMTAGPATNAYTSGDGTSFATPHVAGAVALLAAAYPDATAADLKQALLESVDVLPAFTNKMVSNGRLNVARALSRLSELMLSPPQIFFPPLNQTALAGGSATFTVGAYGAPVLQYQWSLQHTLLPDATNATLTLSNLALSDAGTCSVVVTNPFGEARAAALLDVVPFFLTAQPTNQTVLAGGNVTFSATVTSAVPLACQWQCSGANIPKATNLTLTLSNVQPAQAGGYAVVVSNRFGAVTSDTAFLTVLPLLITTQPQDRLAAAGDTVTFSVVVTSYAPLARQWRWHGTNLPGATDLTYTIPNVQPAHEGDYTVVLSNRFGMVTSEVATLRVAFRITLAEQPRSQTVAVGETVVLTVVAEGTPPFGYRWRWNTNSYYIPVELGTSTLTIPHAALTNAGYYSVVVTNPVTVSRTSTNAYLTVVFPPASQAVCAGTDVTLGAVLNGPKNGPLGVMRYQWQFEGTNLDGATSTNLVLANVQPAQAGNYTFIVTNTAGLATGFTAALTVLVDSDGDGIPDNWELAHGIDQSEPGHANLDPDGDGLMTREEWEAGTDPRDAASCLKLEPLLVLGGTEGVVLQFHAVSNKTYTVQGRADVDSGPWNRVADVTAAPTNRVVELADPLTTPGDAHRFYRLVTPRVP